MPTSKPLTAKEVATIAPSQFVASENTGTLTHDDLYWLLYRASSETGREGSFDTFDDKVHSLLNERLGAGRFGYALTMASGEFSFTSALYCQTALWCGEAGVLPGFGEIHGVYCFVWWT